MAATLDQVLASLNGLYQPQVDSIAQQQAALPAQFDAQAAGIDASKNNAFSDITNQARQRGLGFSGIPLGEQAQYTASTYAPALANLRSTQNQQSQSLVDALNKINEDKFNTGNNLYQFGVQQDYQHQQLAEQQREFDAQQAATAKAAAAANSFNPTLGTSPAPAQPTTPAAFQYIGNNDLRGHLNYLAQKEGNQDASIALKYVGNDGKYNLNPYVVNPSIIAALTRVGATNTWKAAPSVKTAATNPIGGPGINYLGGSTAGLGRL